MKRALALARQGLYTTHPNPRVGCVVVRDGKIVGEGWHRRAGEAHAEINALEQAGNRARGADVYVTLEPCCHRGRTGPCTTALIEAGVKRVVVAMTDPNPQVQGKGLAALRDAGIETNSGCMQALAAALNPGFVMRMRVGRPYVRCKFAMSLDARTAMASGESQWITGPAARRDVQRLRAQSSAVMTGIGTVLADDPSLTVRPDELGTDEDLAPPVHQPMRVVVDTELRTPATAKLLTLPGRVVIASIRSGPAPKSGSDVVTLPADRGGVDLDALLEYLAGEQVNEVLLESGARLAGHMLQSGLIDELVVYMAPTLLGSDARPLFYLPGLERMAEKIELNIIDVCAVGDDWRIRARPINSGD